MPKGSVLSISFNIASNPMPHPEKSKLCVNLIELSLHNSHISNLFIITAETLIKSSISYESTKIKLQNLVLVDFNLYSASYNQLLENFLLYVIKLYSNGLVVYSFKLVISYNVLICKVYCINLSECIVKTDLKMLTFKEVAVIQPYEEYVSIVRYTMDK